MSDEDDATSAHVRALAITSTAALAGVAAAIAAAALTAGLGDPGAAAGSRDAQIAVLVAVIAQIPVYQVVFDEWGGAKDVLYVAFMTFIMWFITYGIILSSGAQIV